MDNRHLKRIEDELWEAADQLRANSKLTASEYAMPVLGLIFLRHAFNFNRFQALLPEVESGLNLTFPCCPHSIVPPIMRTSCLAAGPRSSVARTRSALVCAAGGPQEVNQGFGANPRCPTSQAVWRIRYLTDVAAPAETGTSSTALCDSGQPLLYSCKTPENAVLHASLRRSGGSYIMTVPLSYVEQNHLDAGSRLAIEIVGDELKIRPQRQRKTLAELLKATPRGLRRAEGWDEMGTAGVEL